MPAQNAPDPSIQPAAATAGDHIVRGTAAEGMIRALAIDGTDTVRTAQTHHDASPAATAALGKLLMAAQMMGSLFKVPGELLTLMVHGTGPLGGLTVTADAQGHAKGYAEHVDAAGPDVPSVIGSGTLTVVRDSPHVEPYVSQIALVNGTISDDLTAYYILSEQIPTLVGLEVLMDVNGQVARAGGYFIQLMPDYSEDLLANLEQALVAAGPLDTLLSEGLSPSEILNRILAPLGYRDYERMPASFRCDCSRERSERTLLSLGATELQDMIDAGDPITITCDFCGATYTFSPAELQTLIAAIPS